MGTGMTFEEAKQQQDNALRVLLAASKPASGLAALPLPDAHGRPVEVRRVPMARMISVVGGVNDGLVMLHEDKYVIFVSLPPAPSPYLSGEELDRYLVWHEYSHILNDDVFHEFPEEVYSRMSAPTWPTEGFPVREGKVIREGARRYMEEAEARSPEAAASIRRYLADRR